METFEINYILLLYSSTRIVRGLWCGLFGTIVLVWTERYSSWCLHTYMSFVSVCKHHEHVIRVQEC